MPLTRVRILTTFLAVRWTVVPWNHGASRSRIFPSARGSRWEFLNINLPCLFYGVEVEVETAGRCNASPNSLWSHTNYISSDNYISLRSIAMSDVSGHLSGHKLPLELERARETIDNRQFGRERWMSSPGHSQTDRHLPLSYVLTREFWYRQSSIRKRTADVLTRAFSDQKRKSLGQESGQCQDRVGKTPTDWA